MRALARGTQAPAPSAPVCPRCQAMLVGRMIGGLMLESCVSCDGVWVSALALTQLVVERSAGLADAVATACGTGAPSLAFAAASFARCPECGQPMQRQRLAGQTVAVCRRDGAWFDRGTLAITARAIAHGQLESRGELERAAFRDDLRSRRYPTLLAHARAIGGRLPSRGPLSVLAELFA